MFILIGCFFAIAPGPAILFFFIGGGLISSESRLAARFLDWTDLKIRALVHWSARKWRRLPIIAKGGVVALAVIGSAALAFASYAIVFRR